MAICYDRLSTFKILVSRGASLDKICAGRSYRYKVYPTALQNAAYAGNWDIFSYVLDQPGADRRLHANCWDWSLSNLSHFEPNLLNLVYMGSGRGNRDSRAQIIRELVRRGIRSGTGEEPNTSLLFRACRGGAFGIAFDLITAGAILQYVYESSHTLFYHVLKTPKDLGYPRLDADDAYVGNYYERRPGHHQRERLDLVRLFVEKGYVNINHMWGEGEASETVAMLAATPSRTENGSVETLELVRELGANLQQVNLMGMNALHYLVKRLTSPGPDGTPRTEAFNSSSTIKYLLQDAGLALGSMDAEGRTALDYLHDEVRAITRRELRSPTRSERKLYSWDLLTVQLAETMLDHSLLSPASQWFIAETVRLQVARSRLQAQKQLVHAVNT